MKKSKYIYSNRVANYAHTYLYLIYIGTNVVYSYVACYLKETKPSMYSINHFLEYRDNS